VFYVCITEEEVVWNFQTGSLPGNAVFQKLKGDFNYLQISDVTSYNEGQYSCQTITGDMIGSVTLVVGEPIK